MNAYAGRSSVTNLLDEYRALTSWYHRPIGEGGSMNAYAGEVECH